MMVARKKLIPRNFCPPFWLLGVKYSHLVVDVVCCEDKHAEIESIVFLFEIPMLHYVHAGLCTRCMCAWQHEGRYVTVKIALQADESEYDHCRACMMTQVSPTRSENESAGELFVAVAPPAFVGSAEVGL